MDTDLSKAYTPSNPWAENNQKPIIVIDDDYYDYDSTTCPNCTPASTSTYVTSDPPEEQ
jgi:hypothetical protein